MGRAREGGKQPLRLRPGPSTQLAQPGAESPPGGRGPGGARALSALADRPSGRAPAARVQAHKGPGRARGAGGTAKINCPIKLSARGGGGAAAGAGPREAAAGGKEAAFLPENKEPGA